MKATIRFYLQLMVLMIICFDLSANNPIEYILNLDSSRVVIDHKTIDSIDYTTIEIPDFDNLCCDDAPSIPLKYIAIEVPTYSNKFNVTVTGYDCIDTIKVKQPIIPGFDPPTSTESIGRLSMNLDNKGYIDSNIEPYAIICNETFLNGSEHIVNLGICPIGYDHKKLELYIYSNIQVRLDYKECDKSELTSSPIIISNNASVIDVDYITQDTKVNESSKIGAITKGDAYTLLKNYVIIVPENLKKGINKLVSWKRQKGYNVTAISVEEILKIPQYSIGNNSRCFDKESSIREWLKSFYTAKGPFFCLIIGDYNTSAPIRKFKTTTLSLTDKNDNSYIPGDAYFSDLVSNWSFSKDSSGLYSCDIANSELSLTIPIGRLLCSTVNEIENYTDKLILYELFPGRGDDSYLGNGFIFQQVDAHSTWHSKSLFDALTNVDVTHLKDNNSESMSNLKPLGKDVIASMNKKGLLSWQGHGEPISIECATIKNKENKWPWNRYILAQSSYSKFHDRYSADTMNGLDNMDNEDFPAIAYSLSCTIAPYDDLREEYQYDNKYNMASAFTVAGKYGGPAVLANSREGYFTSSGYMEYEFAKYLKINSCIGIAEMYSKIAVSNQQYTNTKKIRFCHNLIGDPEFNVWINTPKKLTGTIAFSNGNAVVKSHNLDNGVYGMSSSNYSSQKEYNVANGLLSVPYNAFFKSIDNPQYILLYIWKDGYIPVIQMITSGKAIENCNSDIFVVDHYFSKNVDAEATVYPIGKCPAFLNLGKNTNLSLYALNNISSDGGILINDKGTLNIQADSQVSLKNDAIKKGGELNVMAKSTVLEAGFSIEEGGVMSINPKKSFK